MFTYSCLDHGLCLLFGSRPLYILNHDTMILPKLNLVTLQALLIFFFVNLGCQLVLHETGHLLHAINCYREDLSRSVHCPIKFALNLLNLPVDLVLAVCSRSI